MKAMIIKAFGESEVFECAEIEKPEITVGHILVRVAATSVNTVDTKIRQMGEE
ncbi:MAG: NADPH2:quinone reductase [Parasphingorhabdus sp.]|jgi:NADPH2:quinone reductase